MQLPQSWESCSTRVPMDRHDFHYEFIMPINSCHDKKLQKSHVLGKTRYLNIDESCGHGWAQRPNLRWLDCVTGEMANTEPTEGDKGHPGLLSCWWWCWCTSKNTKPNFTGSRHDSEPTNPRKCTKVYYTHSIPTTCFGHSCGHLRGGALQRIHTSKYCRSFWNQYTDIKYSVILQSMYSL